MSHCWRLNVGWNRRKPLKIWKTQAKSKILPRCSYRRHVGYMKLLIRKLPDYIILHNGTNNALNNTSREIVDKTLKLTTFLQKELPKCKITISTTIKRHKYGKASLTISHLSKKFKDLSISAVDNSDIGAFYLNNGGLHLNYKGLGRLAINLKLKIRKL